MVKYCPARKEGNTMAKGYKIIINIRNKNSKGNSKSMKNYSTWLVTKEMKVEPFKNLYFLLNILAIKEMFVM